MTAGQAPKGGHAIANPAAWPARPPAKLPKAALQLQIRRAKSQVGPLAFHCVAIVLLVLAIIFACFPIGLVMVLAPFIMGVSFSVFAICLGLSWFCLLV